MLQYHGAACPALRLALASMHGNECPTAALPLAAAMPSLRCPATDGA